MLTLTPGPIVAPSAIGPMMNPMMRADGNGTAPVGAAPMQGSAAVTAVTDTSATARDERTDGTADRVEPPSDPAPIKGLGIPPLNTVRVGDGDEVPIPPDVMAEMVPALEDSLTDLMPPATPNVDHLA